MDDQKTEIGELSAVVRARSQARMMAAQLGFGVVDQTRFATAISELTRNALAYAGSGTCTLSDESDAVVHRLQAVVQDQGPGIPDVEAAMEDSFSTGGGLGAGLPGTRRIVDEFHIKSWPGGTVVTVAMTRRRQ